MKILVIANQKGGVGKTATSLHIAWYLSQYIRVLLIDLDTQGNASYSLKQCPQITSSGNLFGEVDDEELKYSGDERLIISPANHSLANIQTKPLQEAAQAFVGNLNKLRASNQFDFCIIDTPPSLNNTLVSALMVGDSVLCPIELETYSLLGIQQMATTISNVKKINPSLQFLGILPSKVDMRNPRHRKHLEDIKEKYPQFVIPCTVGLRNGIADALATSIPVWKIRKTAARKAGQEMKAVAAFVASKMKEKLK